MPNPGKKGCKQIFINCPDSLKFIREGQDIITGDRSEIFEKPLKKDLKK